MPPRSLAVLLLAASFLFSNPVSAHEPYEWIMGYETALGQSCCDPTDSVVISHEVASASMVGSKIPVEFNGVPQVIEVNIVHATEDHHGRAWLTRYGCLFKIFGM